MRRLFSQRFGRLVGLAALGLVGALSDASGQIPLPPGDGPTFPGIGVYHPNTVTRIISADLNADGYPDLAWAAHFVAWGLNNGHGKYGESKKLDLPTHLNDVAAGDINNDGKPDLVTGGSKGIDIVLGDGIGGFPIHLPATTDVTRRVRVCDANLDGSLDVVAGLQSAGIQARVHLGDGSGGLGPGIPVGSTSGYTADLDVGDVDQDGVCDVVLGKWNSSAHIYRGDGTGAMVGYWGLPSFGGDTIRFADFDGDGWLDVCGWYDGATSELSIQRADGLGGFTAKQQFKFSGDSVVTLDVDWDGLPEILVPGASDGVAVIDFVGPGGFTKAASLPYLEVGAIVEAADINLDGLSDLLFASDSNYGPRVYRAKAGGGFVDVESHLLPTGTQPFGLDLAQVNNDGRLDLILIDQSGDRFLLSAGNGDGTFANATAIPSGPDPQAIALGDINSDGSLDAVVASQGWLEPNTNTLSSHLGDGQLGFAPFLSSAVGFQPHAVELGDLNGDGNLDAVVASYSDDQVRVLIGNGAGSFSAGLPPLSVSIVGYPGIALGDVDEDGDLDCVLTNPGTQVLVLDGDGTGRLFPPYEAMGQFSIRSDVFLPDLNHDGHLDLVLGASPGGNVGFFLGDGLGQFTHSASSGTVYSPATRLAVSDVDGDGDDDVVASLIGYTDLIQVVRGDGHGGVKDWEVSHAGSVGFAVGIACGDLDGDSRTDTVVVNDPARITVAMNHYTSSSWRSIGGGSPGVIGTPRLSGIGTPTPGQQVGVMLQDAAPGAAVLWLIGASQAAVPFAGGVVVPAPQVSIGPLLVAPSGEMLLVGAWPAGVNGAEFFFQAWIADPVSVGGASASGGLVLIVP